MLPSAAAGRAAPGAGPTAAAVSRAAVGTGIVDVLARRMVAVQVRPLTRAVAPGGRIADLGAGAGARTRALAAVGLEVTAVEPDSAEAARLRAAARPGVVVVEAPLEQWLSSRAPGELDGVLMWHVLEHLADPVAALTAARTATRPGGALLMAVPNPSCWESALFGSRWHGWDPERHRWHIPGPALGGMLVDAGWAPLEVTARGGWGYPTGIAYSLAPGLDPQRAGGLRARLGLMLAAACLPAAAMARMAGRGGQLVAVAHARRRP